MSYSLAWPLSPQNIAGGGSIGRVVLLETLRYLLKIIQVGPFTVTQSAILPTFEVDPHGGGQLLLPIRFNCFLVSLPPKMRVIQWKVISLECLECF